MCMIIRDNQVLVQNRTKNDWPGLTFPGGKVEPNESIYESVIREVKEETGLEVEHLSSCGIIHYELKAEKERWLIFLYKTKSFKGELYRAQKEDEIFWIDREELNHRKLSNDLDAYLKVFEEEDILEAYAYYKPHTSSTFHFYRK